MVSPALLALRAATAERHAELESCLRIAGPHAGREEYSAHVAAMWGWLRPIEPSLWDGPWPRELEAPQRAVKSRWLEDDIAAARADGFLEGAIALFPHRVEFDGLAHRMGWAYAIEGSMLGAQVLMKRLGDRLSPWPARFLQGYRDDCARRWRTFLEMLAGHATTRDEIDAATRGAVEAFETLGAWYRRKAG